MMTYNHGISVFSPDSWEISLKCNVSSPLWRLGALATHTLSLEVRRSSLPKMKIQRPD